MNGKIGELRPSQLITTFGPGAIIDLPDFSVIIAGTDYWDTTRHCHKIPEPRLEKKLGIKKILSPPVPEQESHFGTLPAFQFPRYLVCPKCRKLAFAYRFYIRKNVALCQCDKDNPPKAFPARFIQACPKGHIDDFPWHSYVHGIKKNYDCLGEDLRLNDLGATGSIADVQVECKTCSEKRTMVDAFFNKALGKCSGRRPWLGRQYREECTEKARAMLRGASNIYFPIIDSALVIPPFDNPLHTIVSEISDRLTQIDTLEKLTLVLGMGMLPELNDYQAEDIWQAMHDINDIEQGAGQDLLYPEWEAILRGSQPDGSYEFETQNNSIPTRFDEYLSNLIMVRRLSEVRVLQGFTRINPPPDVTSLISGDDEPGAISRRASLSTRHLGWYPGILTRGEGIFISLKEEMVQAWEEKRAFRIGEAMREAYEEFLSDRGIPLEEARPFPGVRYVLLHTLAHALIRQLCMSSGYSSSALRERIYSRKKDGQNMSGLLIYTATPDSEGSLGGLVELGSTDNFDGILWQALQDARFCSGDPLCAEHQPDALNDLNGAACHACLLASETSCEISNRFLDRTFLVPTVSKSNLAFFDKE